MSAHSDSKTSRCLYGVYQRFILDNGRRVWVFWMAFPTVVQARASIAHKISSHKIVKYEKVS